VLIIQEVDLQIGDLIKVATKTQTGPVQRPEYEIARIEQMSGVTDATIDKMRVAVIGDAEPHYLKYRNGQWVLCTTTQDILHGVSFTKF
jgi:hypothetical protein